MSGEHVRREDREFLFGGDDRLARVVVVGGGMGGLTAALSALARGIRVTLVEKADTLGGSAALANGMRVTYADFDVMRSEARGGNERLQELVHSALPTAAAWLAGLGVELRPVLELMGRYSGWSFSPGQFIGLAAAEIARRGGTVLTATSMDGLVVENGAVKGVEAVGAARGRINIFR